MRKLNSGTRAVCFAVALLAVFTVSPASAATTITVINTADSGAGSLRDAIASAVSGDTIDFGVTGTITLTSGHLLINTDLTITGPGPSMLAIDGGNSDIVFFVGGPGITVNISGVTIQHGNAGGLSGIGGGILNNPNTLTLTNCKISQNSAPSLGGGIWNNGTLTLNDSTVSGNTAGSNGAGIYNLGGVVSLNNSTVSGNVSTFGFGGGIWTFNNGTPPAGAVTLTNSTVANNTASLGLGGGLFNSGGPSPTTGAELTLNNTTISGNSAPTGAGIWNAGVLRVKNSVIANSVSGDNCFQHATNGSSTSYGHNLSDDSSCSASFTATGDTNGVAAGLDPAGLQDNGGPTETIALLGASPAVDAVPTADCTTVGSAPITSDQRGVSRPQGVACDIGAFELESSVTAFSSLTASLTVVSRPRPGFVLSANITLGAATDGIDPATEAVKLSVGSYEVTIPGGSFRKVENGPRTSFVFIGIIDGVGLRAQITPQDTNKYLFSAQATPVILAKENPVAVAITIGNDSGNTQVVATFR